MSRQSGKATADHLPRDKKKDVRAQASSFIASNSPAASSSSTVALHQLLSPDGYYAYLNIPKSSTVKSSRSFDETKEMEDIDVDQVKKNYRRLSLRHHPDRPTGDAEAFRVLNRAKRVLTSPKLRKEYDLLGLDLEEEEEDDDDDNCDEEETEDLNNDTSKNSNGETQHNEDSGKEKKADSKKKKKKDGPDSALSHLASVTLAAVLQLGIRTAMMGSVATLITRYKLLAIPSILFLMYMSYTIYSAARHLQKNTPSGGIVAFFRCLPTRGQIEIVAPLVIATGIICMHRGGQKNMSGWSWTFWLGEILVMTMFMNNSVPPDNAPTQKKPYHTLFFLSLLSTILTLLLRGKFWRYVMVMALEATLAFLTVIIFPIMEMILEEIMNEKLRKIGEKVRAYSKRMEEITEQKIRSSCSDGRANGTIAR